MLFGIAMVFIWLGIGISYGMIETVGCKKDAEFRMHALEPYMKDQFELNEEKQSFMPEACLL